MRTASSSSGTGLREAAGSRRRASPSSPTRESRSAVDCPSCATRSRRPGIEDPIWFEVPKSKLAPKQVRKALDARRGPRVRVGRRRHGAALRRRDGRLRRRARDRPRRDRQPLRVEPRDPERHPRPRSRSGCTGDRHRFDVGQHQRRALRGDGRRRLRRADDRRRRRRVEGPARARRVRLHRREEPRRSDGSGHACASTARSGSRARRAACSSATSASSWATSPRSPTLGPTTACSRSASSPPRAAGSGRARSCAPPWGTPTTSPFVETARGRAFDIRFDEPVRYELDGGNRKKAKRLRIKVRAAAR